MATEKYNKQELGVYALLWAALFLAPVLGTYVSSANDADRPFEWGGVLLLWRQYALFFVVFLIHNFLLAPLLIERQRRWLYFSLVALLLTLFTFVQCRQRPAGIMPRHDVMETRQPGFRPGGVPMDDDMPRLDDMPRPDDMPPAGWDGDAPKDEYIPGPGSGRRNHPDRMHAPMLFEQHDIVVTVILILMLGMNLGVKLYFRQRRDRQRMQQLERQSLEQQLEYLRYQINPHFLMNTLNNIHALVDIDAERAKDSIVQLSKIMRFVLYEGAKQTVPLARELAFTQDYILLMRMRVTDRVSITVDMPGRVPDRLIPPLVLITFVENAFKHGISYQQPSFISIAVEIAEEKGSDEQQLIFTCSNSKLPAADDSHGGVGLQNARQRLDLIYGKRYSLSIDDTPDSYNILLTIPLLKENGTDKQ